MASAMRWLMAFLGVGVLPLSKIPSRSKVITASSFVWGLSLMTYAFWTDREVLATLLQTSFTIYHISRFLVMFFLLWWSHWDIVAVVSRLELVFQKLLLSSMSTKRHSGIFYYLLAMSPFVFAEILMFKKPYECTIGRFIFVVMSKFLLFLVPALYIFIVERLTLLFLATGELWKTELQKSIDGSQKSDIQTYRILHTEISSTLPALMAAFDLNLLFYFFCLFCDIVVGFHRLAYNGYGYLEFSLKMTESVACILSMIKFTEDMISASESITSNIRSLCLSQLPALDQLQVELLQQKLVHRPVRVDVCGMFTINKQLIVELIMGATTCCNVIVQLKPYLQLELFPIDKTNVSCYSNCTTEYNSTTE